jgi:hypothetical protein
MADGDNLPTVSEGWSADRRTALKTIGTGVAGMVAATSGVAAQPETQSHTEPYDTREEDQIETDDGTPFAQVQSVVNGPKTVDDDRGSINMSVAIPIGYSDDSRWSGSPMSTRNLQVEFGVTSVPGDFDAQNIDVLKQGDSNSDHHQWLTYAIDLAWDSSVGWFVPVPSPSDLLIDDDNTDVSRPSDDEGYTVTYDGLGESYEGAGVDWEVDFYAHNGSTPTGTWDFYVRITGDLCYYSTGMYDPGWQKVDDFSHYHDVEVDVTS